jgi:hypothetical protein
MRQVVAIPAADDGAVRCSDRGRPPAPLDHPASKYPISRRRPTAAFLAGDVTPLAALALSPHGRSPPAVGRADKASTGLPRITRCRLRPLYPKPRSAAMAKPVPRPGAGRPIGRVPTPVRSGRHESAQQGLHSPLAVATGRMDLRNPEGAAWASTVLNFMAFVAQTRGFFERRKVRGSRGPYRLVRSASRR